MKLRTPAALLPLLLFVLTGAATLRAQQPATDQAVSPPAAAPAPVAEPATPAPRPSPLFERTEDNAPTLAAAKKADEAAKMEGRHTITVTTTVLVLAIIILVLLID